MTARVRQRNPKITVGPPGGPTCAIPVGFTVWITDEPPYDLRLDVAWNPGLGRHSLHELTITEQPDGDYVRMTGINHLALADTIERTLADAVLGTAGWPGIVATHPDADPVALDALIYRLAYALGGQRPAATIAIARGLALSTGPKRAGVARQLGLIPPAEPGKASG